MAQSDNEEAKNNAKAEVDRIFAEIDAKRLALDAKKADDSFVLGEHKITAGSAASRPGPDSRPRGRNGGRTFALSKAQVRLAQAAMAHRDTSVSALCRELGIRPVTLYRYVGP